MKYTRFLFFAAVCVPAFAHADVIINEIAWMGTTVSANDEWVELRNTGLEDVSLTGWRLSGADGAPNIALSGTITAQGFFLLERSDDETVPGIAADVIYTGALGNDVESLKLTDASGAVVDSVESGENWSLGGDNTTKHTAQRQGDTTWITGEPTPRAENSTHNTKTEADTGGEVAGTSTSKTTTVTKSAKGYVQKIYTYAGDDMQSVAGAYAFFNGYGIDGDGNQASNARYEWTFGDGGEGSGGRARHIYRFPGTYTAVLSVSHESQTARDKTVVRVVPADVEITDVQHGPDGFIEIRNRSADELDVSLWKIRVVPAAEKKKTKTFSFPITTTISPLSSVPIPSAITRIETQDGNRILLVLPSGKTAALFEDDAADVE